MAKSEKKLEKNLFCQNTKFLHGEAICVHSYSKRTVSVRKIATFVYFFPFFTFYKNKQINKNRLFMKQRIGVKWQ